MTGARRLLWALISVLSVFVMFGLSLAAFAVGRDDWVAFFQSRARVGAFVVTLALSALSVFSDFGGMNPGKKEDRGNRWIFGPFVVLALGLAVLPPYLDGRDWWVTDEAVTPYVGLALLTLGGALRLAAVFVLGRRFTGLVAIQEGHRLQTTGLYRYIRHPSYTGMLLYMGGYVLVFRCWLGLLLVAGTLAVLLARMNAEEALLESEFGEEYASYRRRTWRLVPWERLFVAGIAVFVAWMLIDALAHRMLLQPLYEPSASLWRPISEMSPVLIGAVTVLLIVVFLTTYKVLVRPKSFAAGLYLGGLLGAALGASAGFGTYIHSPIPLALAWGWFVLGTVKGLIAGMIIGTLVRENNND